MANEFGLIKWTEIDRTIMGAPDLQVIADTMTKLEAIRLIAKDKKMGVATINRVVGYLIKAAIKGGELYTGLDDDRDRALNEQSSGKLTTDKQQAAKELGKSRQTISQWVKIWGKVAGELGKVDAYVAECADEKEASIDGFYRSLKQPVEFVYAELPKNKYHVIYADPPWKISESEWKDKWGGAYDTINEKYPRLTTEQICELKVPDLAADSCVLFLWATHTFLPDAFGVCEAWGFKYNGLITWDKGGGWTSQKLHRSTEFCLYCLKGPINYKGDAFPALIQEKKTTHSTKPAIMRKLIEERIPEPRIELFARTTHKGWRSWGNQI